MKINKLLESKKLRESDDKEVIFQKGNKKIIKDGYGYGIEDDTNVTTNRFYVNGKGEPKFEDGTPSKFWLDKVKSLVKSGKITSRKDEGYSHFEFTSGSNPYIAKTKDEAERVKRNYRDSAKFIKSVNGIDYYKVDDEEKDLFSVDESFKPTDSGIQSVKCYNRYNYTIQELRVDNDNKTFERGQFTVGKPDKKTKNRQEFEDIVDSLKELGYTEIESEYKSMRNKSRKGNLTSVEEGYELNPDIDIAWRPYDNEKGQVMADKWYASKWPDDEVGIEQLTGITLDDALKDRSILGHCDTQVRERVYAQLDKYIPLSFDSPMYKEKNESKSISKDRVSLTEDVDSFRPGDTVYVKPSKKLGRVKSVKGDYVEVEVMGGNDPDRIDTYYTSDLELQSSLNESSNGECWAIFAKDNTSGIEYCGGVYNSEDSAHYWASMDRLADSEYGYGNFTYRVEQVPEYSRELYDSYVALQNLKLDNSNKNQELSEASYGGAFDIADDQYFTREDIENAAEEVLSHIQETFREPYHLGGTWFEDGKWIVNVQSEDSMEEYEAEVQVDMRKIKEPWHLKRAYASNVAADIIQQIKDQDADVVESKEMNESPVVSSAYEFDDDVDELTYYYDDEELKDALNDVWEEIASKRVADSDGFMTDYTMYRNINTDEYVFVFGDKEIYRPEDGYFDWECETKEEAEEWFNTYNGFDDSDDDIEWMYEDVEESPVLHKKPDGSYLVSAESGDGYTAYNKSDVWVGHISADNEQEAKNKFNANKFDESLGDIEMRSYKVTYYLPYYDDGFGDDLMNYVLEIEAPDDKVANELAVRHLRKMRRSANGEAWQNAKIVSIQ